MNAEDMILEFLRKMPRRNGISVGRIAADLYDKYRKKTVYNTVNNLKKKKYILYEGKHVRISPDGTQFLVQRNRHLSVFARSTKKNARRNLLVLFDIPEDRKAEREWFRRQLVCFGYIMIQKSVWFGPSPLPREFIVYIDSIGLKEHIKMFSVSEKQLT